MTEAPMPPKADQTEVENAVEAATEAPADAPVGQQIEAADVAISVAAGQWRDTPAIKTLSFLSEIADQPPAFTLAAVAALGGLASGRPRMAEAGLRGLAALAIATWTKAAVKSAVVRTRPYMLLERAEYSTGLNGPDEGPWNSFPSGHTANAVAAARVIGRVYPDLAPAAGLGALGIAAIQVPRGAHYPIDVIAGAAVGWAAEQVVDRGATILNRAMGANDGPRGRQRRRG